MCKITMPNIEFDEDEDLNEFTIDESDEELDINTEQE